LRHSRVQSLHQSLDINTMRSSTLLDILISRGRSTDAHQPVLEENLDGLRELLHDFAN
jgi:hypothetical protein